MDISDQDWQCFFTQCEECNLLPPSLAGLESSGMSDMDDIGAFFAKKAQKVEPKAGLIEEVPFDSPIVREVSPEEQYPVKHSSGGMESVLSGSEEDIHLQSVNMFFERMQSLTGSQKTPEHSQVEAVKNRAVQGELCGDRHLSSCNGRALPRNIPKLNSVSARGEATGRKTADPVSTIRNTHIIRTDDSSSESSTSIYVRHPYLNTQLFIQESSPENTVNEIIDPDDSPYKAVCSTHADKVIRSKKQACLCDVRNYSAPRKTQCSDLCSNPDISINSKWTEDKGIQVSHSDSEGTYKPKSKESSPCVSIKRKRRKKRRLSVEPTENVFGIERLYDSEDELFTCRRAMDPFFPKNFNWPGFRGAQINRGFMSSFGTQKLSSSLPVVAAKKDSFLPNQHSCHCQHEKTFKQANLKESNKMHDNLFNNQYDQKKEKLIPTTEAEVKEDTSKYTEMSNSGSQTDKEQTQVTSSRNTIRNKVKSITNATFPSAESKNLPMDDSQSNKLSTSKSAMREETETEKLSQCQEETVSNQQLETDCPSSYQSRRMAENLTPAPRETAMSASNITQTLDHKAGPHVSQSGNMQTSDCASLIVDNGTSSPCNLIMNGGVHETVNAMEVDSSPCHEITMVCEAPRASGNFVACGDMRQTNELQAFSESSSYSTSSSCYSPEMGPVVSLLNESMPLKSSSVSSTDLSINDENSKMVVKTNKIDPITKYKNQDLSHEAEEPCRGDVEAAMTTSEQSTDTTLVDPNHQVFAMSSFWKDMEKLTINDILGLRKDTEAQSSFLPPLQETDDPDYFTLSDSGCCTQADERKDCTELPSTIPVNPADIESNIAITNDSSLQRSILWESERVQVNLSDSMFKGTVSDISEPIKTPSGHKGLRKISKNISVQNLRVFGSNTFKYKYNNQATIKTLEEDNCNKSGYLPEDTVLKNDAPSLAENFKISISDIYNYFLGEKQSDTSHQTATDNIAETFTGGDSVPENYDHFFSEFDTDTFFYTDEPKSEMVPIFSCSRSSNRKIELEDAYDYVFFSSSDNSPAESDEEDFQECAPIRVVTRFTRKPSSNDIVTDAYEHFYTDHDLKQDFFKTTFSFRNSNLNGNNLPKNEPTNALAIRPLKREGSFRIKAMPITVLGNEDLVFSDRLLQNFDNQIITKLQQPLIYKSLQTAVTNPSLDVPLMLLRQSDMCLICIAFASWVQKTTNPQIGDAWKAVLLANVSAISAIRYLRRYIKVQASGSEKKSNLKALCIS